MGKGVSEGEVELKEVSGVGVEGSGGSQDNNVKFMRNGRGCKGRWRRGQRKEKGGEMTL